MGLDQYLTRRYYVPQIGADRFEIDFHQKKVNSEYVSPFANEFNQLVMAEVFKAFAVNEVSLLIWRGRNNRVVSELFDYAGNSEGYVDDQTMDSIHNRLKQAVKLLEESELIKAAVMLDYRLDGIDTTDAAFAEEFGHQVDAIYGAIDYSLHIDAGYGDWYYVVR